MADTRYQTHDGDALLLVVGSLLMLFGTGAVALRSMSTYLAYKRSKVEWKNAKDIGFLVVGLAFAFPSTALLIYIGSQNVPTDTNPEQVSKTLRIQWTGFCLAAISTGLVRLSNLASLLQIQKQRRIQTPDWLIAVAYLPIVTTLALTVAIAVMFGSLYSSRTFSANTAFTGSSLANVLLVFFIVHAAIAAIIDLALGAEAARVMYSMGVSRATAIQLIPFILCGVMTSVLAMVTFGSLIKLHRSSSQLQSGTVTMLWLSMEVWGSMFIVSLPRLQALSAWIAAYKLERTPPGGLQPPTSREEWTPAPRMGFVSLEPSILRELEIARLRTRINEHHQDGQGPDREVLVHTEYYLQQDNSTAVYIDPLPVHEAPSANMAGSEIPHIPQPPSGAHLH